jgi:glycosyltransferase involved in cell wall biosynthesis
MIPDRPRVLIIPASYFVQDRTIGGGERYALEYARALSRLIPVTLGLFDLQSSTKQEESLTIRTFSVRHFNQRRGFPITRETWKAFQEFDVFHVMVFPTPLADLLLLAARLWGKKVVLTDVGGGGSCWSTYLQKLNSRWNLAKLAHGLAHLSHYAARFYTDWPQPQISLYGGVVVDEKAPIAPPQGYALYAGRLLPHKGVLQLIDALPLNVELRVVGRPYDAEYFQKLQQMARGKQVQFYTQASDEELRDHYRGASVVLQPSLPASDPATDKSELLGLVALEAMAHGKPVIVTSTASLQELVVDGQTGYIVPPNDTGILRQRIESLVHDNELSVQMGMAARRRVQQHFTWQQAAQRGKDFYTRL